MKTNDGGRQARKKRLIHHSHGRRPLRGSVYQRQMGVHHQTVAFSVTKCPMRPSRASLKKAVWNVAAMGLEWPVIHEGPGDGQRESCFRPTPGFRFSELTQPNYSCRRKPIMASLTSRARSCWVQWPQPGSIRVPRSCGTKCARLAMR